MNETEQQQEEQKSRHSNLTYLSFGMYQLAWTTLVSALGLYLYYYYHAIIGLDPLVILLATVLLTFWYGLNDPLIGYLLDRNFKWTRKWGRRFPWILICAVPWSFSIVLIFAAPDAKVNPWPAFFWFIMANAIYETLITTLDINIGALRADKFRTEGERKKYSAFFAPLDMIALALGFILPTLFIGFATGSLSYTIMAVFIGAITLIFMVLFIPSTREDKIIIDRYFDRKYERMTFFKGIVKALKTKSFLAFLIQYSLFLTATTILTAIIVYVINFIILDPNMMMVLMAIFIVGAIVAVPFWQKIFKKLNNTKKYYVMGNLILVIALFPATFFQGLIDLAIMMFIIGFAMSSVWTFGIPVILSNTQDDFVVSTGVNQKGLLLGAWGLLTITTSFLDELVIGIVFTATGFVGGIEDYVQLVATVADVNLVLWGIRLLIGVIPAIIILIGALVFWKFFPLTQEKILENKRKLKELKF